jgi:alpha-L-fucosidase
VEVYDNLYKKWKPDNFDPREWVQIAKDGGMKYMIFLVKHHDGFCLYDSKLTDYRSTGPESAWKVDVMKHVADACHAADLKLIIYYSQPDWHHPDYRTKNHHRYIKYLHGQVRELLTNYGRIDGFWFDLGGKPEDWDSEALFKMMRTLQPWLIINNRCGLPGDFDTPEQRLGKFQLKRPWETCMTLGTQWAWKPDDNIKSLKECIDVLVTCAGRNGNLALNTGPMPNGEIEPRQAQRFREIGRWLKQYGQSIYGTRGGPFWGLGCVSTRKDRTVYVHVLKWYDDRVLLPAIPRNVVSHTVLTGGTATVRQTPDGLEIAVPPEHRSDLDTIVALELDGPAAELAPAQVLSGPLTYGKKASASHMYDANPRSVDRYRPEKAVDGDPRSGWTFNPDVKSAWLEVDLGKPYTFDRAWINELHDRIRRFELQAERGGSWQTFCHGTTIGEDFTQSFAPVTARRVRLVVLETTTNPLVGEFQLFEARTPE